MTKHTKADLKRNYTLYVQSGLVLSLLFILAVTKTPMQRGVKDYPETVKFNPEIQIMVIENTDEIKPAPAKPYVPIEVSDDKPIEDIVIDFPDFDFDEPRMTLPPKQNEDTGNNIVEGWGVEVMPIMIGGLSAFYSELTYPELAKRANIEGKVIVQFIVNKLGEVESPEILRGIGGGCDEEVLRVIKKMRFSPGIQNDITVNVRMTQPVVFKLTN